MQPVEIVHNEGAVVLRARASELLILPFHVKELQGLKKPQGFAEYFKSQALVNRPARKLFEAWLRKDGTLWPRLFKTVHEEMDAVELEEETEAVDEVKTTKPEANTEKKAIKKEPTEKKEKVSASKTEKEATKKAAKKTAKKAAKKTAKKAAKKTAKKQLRKLLKKQLRKLLKKQPRKLLKKQPRKLLKKQPRKLLKKQPRKLLKKQLGRQRKKADFSLVLEFESSASAMLSFFMI